MPEDIGSLYDVHNSLSLRIGSSRDLENLMGYFVASQILGKSTHKKNIKPVYEEAKKIAYALDEDLSAPELIYLYSLQLKEDLIKTKKSSKIAREIKEFLEINKPSLEDKINSFGFYLVKNIRDSGKKRRIKDIIANDNKILRRSLK